MSSPMHPLGKPRLADRNAEDMDNMSAASESDAGEPPSVMMPPRNQRDTADETEDLDDFGKKAQSLSLQPRYGVLDDVPDDYELNIEGFRYIPTGGVPNSTSELGDDPHSSVIASSLLRHPDKSYTKLEVISARQIRSLILFFNFFVLSSITLVTFMLVQVRTDFTVTISIPLPGGLFTKEEREQLRPLPILIFDPVKKSRQYVTEPHESDAAYDFDQIALRDRMYHMPWTTAPHIELASRQGGTPTSPSSPSSPTRPPPASAPNANSTAVANRPNRPPRQGTPKVVVFYEFKAEIAQAPKSYQHGVHWFSFALSLVLVFFTILFAIRIVRARRRNITHEQIWVLVLLIVSSLYMNPVGLLVEILSAVESGKRYKWVDDLDKIFGVWRDLSFTGVSYFYIWASLHSFRILDPTKRLEFVPFYLPKLVILFLYCLYHVLAVALSKLWLSEVPLLSGIAFGYAFGQFRVRQYLWVEMWLSLMRTLMDLGLIILMAVEAVRTYHVLERAPYMKHRAKRVGFRFFLFMTFTFYCLFITEHMVHLFLIPKGTLILTAAQPIINFLRVDVLWYFTPGPAVLLVGYVLTTAFVYLPYTSVGWLKGWFVSSTLGDSSSRWSFTSQGRSDAGPSMVGSEDTEKGKYDNWGQDEETPVSLVDNDKELQQQIVEPITYRKRESKDSLELKANCFTMQTHVIMFNFAWYVYYYGTPKLDNFRPKENPLPFEFRIDIHIKSQATDTQALVLDCTDRIIVAFKGTTSMKNLRTSLQMNQARLSTVIRYNADGDDEFTRLRKLFGQDYLWGKVHRGFATAYLDVADDVVDRVRALRNAKKRPVFLTGHSLGGALATICSLDLWVKLNVSRREIFVSTFGSPRVGNLYFASMYKQVVPLHWRIVVDPDMIAKLPRIGYTHVGKKVVLTPHGEMIIDPSALEQRPWTGESAGFVYHRKASYMLAMRAWCVRNHGMTYTPVFWPFPVRPDDERRFASAFDEGDVHVGGGRVAAKIIRMDAMVDALGDGTELDNMAAVERWGRLTRRVLLNDKLSGTA